MRYINLRLTDLLRLTYILTTYLVNAISSRIIAYALSIDIKINDLG